MTHPLRARPGPNGDASPAIVAIPARDEAGRIEACLRALADQRALDGGPLDWRGRAVLVLANDCADDTAARARALQPALPFALLCREVRLPPALAHAGGARRAALDLAADHLAAALLPTTGARDGVLLSTDADTRARPDWLARNLAAIAAGADAVAGSIALDPAERPPLFAGARHLEAAYADLSAEIAARLDPRPHDPWPNHRWAWGASLAVRLSAYRRIGGLPAVRLAEDRALVARIEAADLRVRHALDVGVWTSPRLAGRAPGGYADLLRSYVADEDAPCDALLEPALLTCRRALWRARLRRLHALGRLGAVALWAPRLNLSAPEARALLGPPAFGAVWQAVERASPRLVPVRLRPRQLPEEIEVLERVLARLRRDAAGRAGSAPAAPRPAPRPPLPGVG